MDLEELLLKGQKLWQLHTNELRIQRMIDKGKSNFKNKIIKRFGEKKWTELRKKIYNSSIEDLKKILE